MGWELDANEKYQSLLPNEQGWLWSSVLGLWLGSWEGSILKEQATWLRFYDPAGNLISLPKEDALAERQRAELAEEQVALERQRADLLAARLRELGTTLQSLGMGPLY